MNEQKYLILVFSCHISPFDDIINAQKETWESVPNPPEMKTIFYYADLNKETSWEGDTLYIKTEEADNNFLKSLLALEEVIKKYPKLTHVFFTNASTYVIKDRILNVFNSLPLDNAYSGELSMYIPHPKYGVTFRYASGAGFFLSRNLCDDIVTNKHKFQKYGWGDLEIGYYFHSKKIYATYLPRLNLDRCGYDVIDNLKLQDLEGQFHIRCKRWDNRLNDKIVMKKIYNVLNNK